MVECDLAKVEVAGSNPVSRSNFDPGGFAPADLPTRSLARPPFARVARFARERVCAVGKRRRENCRSQRLMTTRRDRHFACCR